MLFKYIFLIKKLYIRIKYGPIFFIVFIIVFIIIAEFMTD